MDRARIQRLPVFVVTLCFLSLDIVGPVAAQRTPRLVRDIAPGEEVCFDYAMTDASPYDQFNCSCDTPLCRGQVTGNDWMLPELQERYRGFFSTYVQKRIETLGEGVRF